MDLAAKFPEDLEQFIEPRDMEMVRQASNSKLVRCRRLSKTAMPW